MLHDLLHEDLHLFNPRKLPHSQETFRIKLRSSDSSARYIYEALNEGCFDLEHENNNSWQDTLSHNELYTYYRHWCTTSGETEIDKSRFGASLKKFIPSIKDRRPYLYGKRTYAYQIPPLDQARKDFCSSFKAKETHIFYQNTTEQDKAT